MTYSLVGSLEPRAGGQHVGGCLIEVTYRWLKMLGDLGEITVGRATAVADDAGRFIVELPDPDYLVGDGVEISVSAASGTIVGRTAASYEEITGGELVVSVSMPPEIVVPPATPIPPAKTYRITGTLIDEGGASVPSGLQVLLLVTPEGAGDNEPPRPVFAANVGRSGGFLGDLPTGRVGRATALIPGVARLVDVALEDGRVPAELILVVDLSEVTAENGDAEGCDCGTTTFVPRTPTHADIERSPSTYSDDLGAGQCVQFTTPNRSIEEFDFFTVVRTTEPGIRGVVLQDTADREVAVASADPATPTEDPVTAASYEVTMVTGPRGTWGGITVSLVTDDQEKLVIMSKGTMDERFGPVPDYRSLDYPLLNLDGGSTTSRVAKSNIDHITGIGLDLRRVRGIEVMWVESNGNDAWILQSIAVTATTTTGERVPILINGTQTYTSPAGIFMAVANSGEHQYLRATAEIAARTQVAGAPAIEPQVVPPSRWSTVAQAEAGRTLLDGTTSIDWDSTPTLYEATSVAHGHLLHFRQVWYADGYSLGDLLYSLPLAPGQKKLVSVVDWEGSEVGSQEGDSTSREGVEAVISRDRDLGEVVTGALSESVKGGSRSTTAGVGAGMGAAGNGSYLGFNFGALLGVSGGYGESDSNAWQNSARDVASGSLQSLRDRTMQSASAVRGLRTSVVRTVTQAESARATTEVVANHNHCHAITIQYFEVLRHLRMTHEIVDVEECLFVPMPMSAFDVEKVGRWRQALRTYLQRPELAPGLDAARRVETHWANVDYPAARYADESVTSISGEFELTVLIPLPPFPERPKPTPGEALNATEDAITEAIAPTTGFLAVLLAVVTGGASLVVGETTKAAKTLAQGSRALAEEMFALPTPQERYDKFQHDVMPDVVAGFVDQLQLWAVVRGAEVRVTGVDFTLVSEYAPGVPLVVGLQGTPSGRLVRGEMTQLIIKSEHGLPTGSRAIVNSASLRYRTRSFQHALVDDRRLNDDIDLPTVSPLFNSTTLGFTIERIASGSGAALSTPIDAWEQRNPRREDARLAVDLIDHLNANLEYYHQAIWWTMDPNRRFMLLDGHVAPGSGGRSLASIVENRLIGIVGNSLVLPVSSGNEVNPRFRRYRDRADRIGASHVADGRGGSDDREGQHDSARLDLLRVYAASVPPARVSLPTRGVFAEAVMGACDACERIDDSKLWRWDESPIDEPPMIDASALATRRKEPDLSPSPFPTPIVQIQNAPTAPDAAGVAAAIAALGKGSFADITGLAGNQANAAAAYAKAVDTALQYGKEASVLANQAAMVKSKDKALNAIDRAEQAGGVDAKTAEDLRVKVLRKLVADEPVDPKASAVSDRLKVVDDRVASHGLKPDRAEQISERIMRGLDPEPSPGTLLSMAGQVPPGFVLAAGGIAPAHKTGVGGTRIPSPELVSSWTKFGDWVTDLAVAAFKAEEGQLMKAVGDASMEIAKGEVDQALDAVPFVGVMKQVIRYSMVFAEGAGKVMESSHDEIQRVVNRAAGFTDEQYPDLEQARAWMLLGWVSTIDALKAGLEAVTLGLLEQTADALLESAKHLATQVHHAVAARLISASKVDRAYLAVAREVEANVPEARLKVYAVMAEKMARIAVAQLRDPARRTALEKLLTSPRPGETAAIGLLRSVVELGISTVGSRPLQDVIPADLGISEQLTIEQAIECELRRVSAEIIKGLKAEGWSIATHKGATGIEVDTTSQVIRLPVNDRAEFEFGSPAKCADYLTLDFRTDEGAYASLVETAQEVVSMQARAYQAEVDASSAATWIVAFEQARKNSQHDASEANAMLRALGKSFMGLYTGTPMESYASAAFVAQTVKEVAPRPPDWYATYGSATV